MKQIIVITFLLNVTWVCAAQDSVYLFSYFKDNGKDGLHFAWSEDGFSYKALNNDKSYLTPVLTKDSLMRDPCIIRGADGHFHMVWTASWNDRGIGYASSADLANWSVQKYLPVMALEDSALNCWAPEITYDPRRNRYVIYWATTIPGRFPMGKTSGDGRYNHRIYFVTTTDFDNFSKTQLLYNKDFSVIDATIFPAAKDGVMVLKDETLKPPQKNLRVATSNMPHRNFGPPSAPITGNYWAEGPTVARVGDQWVVYFDKYRDKKYGAVASKDLVQWSDISDKIFFPHGTRHGTVLRISRGELNALLSPK